MTHKLTLENIQKYQEDHQEDLKSLNQFKLWFETSSDICEEEASRMIQSLYQTILFNLSLKPSPFSFDDQKKCVEHIILSQFYQIFFISQDNLEVDVELLDKIEKMRKLPLEHFNLPTIFFKHKKISLAMNHLSQINQKKTSYEKLECINSFFRTIVYYNDESKMMNSDDILEIITYLIIHTVSPLIYSNIAFIRKCNFDISDENDYYLTQLEIAIQSIMCYIPQKDELNDYKLTTKLILSPPIVNCTSFLN